MIKRVIRCDICGLYKRLGKVRGRVCYTHTHDERVLCNRALERLARKWEKANPTGCPETP